MWLVTFNATKTKLITFHHHRNNPDFPQIAMDGMYLNESTCLNKLLCLMFTPDLKWNAYIDSVAKDAAKMVGSLYRSMRLLTPESNSSKNGILLAHLGRIFKDYSIHS